MMGGPSSLNETLVNEVAMVAISVMGGPGY